MLELWRKHGAVSIRHSTEEIQRMIDRMLRRPEVEEAIGLSRATLYRMVERGDFPRPTKLSEHAVGLRERRTQEWLEGRTA